MGEKLISRSTVFFEYYGSKVDDGQEIIQLSLHLASVNCTPSMPISRGVTAASSWPQSTNSMLPEIHDQFKIFSAWL